MKEREKLQLDLQRYRVLLVYMTDEKALAALEELIEETLDRLDQLAKREITRQC
jgi:hypothetical protein